jgi:hypothetical protein
MSLPVCLSVSKAKSQLNAVADQIRRVAADDWNYLKSVSPLVRPFLAVWFWLLHGLRYLRLFGCYIVLCFAWTCRVTVTAVVVAAIGLVIAAMNGAFDSPKYSDSTYTLPPVSVPTNGATIQEPVYQVPSAPVYGYGYSQQPAPVSSSSSSVGQVLQDPLVQQGLIDGAAWLLDAYLNQGANGGAPKTQYVHPYVRQDGTPVRDYYRADPSR